VLPHFPYYLKGFEMAVKSITDAVSSKSQRIDKNDVTIVIPTLNEELALGVVIQNLLAEKYYNILVVDGISTDNTVAIAESLGIEVVQQKGLGKSGAIQTALKTVVTPYIIIIDGDNTYFPKDIHLLLPYLRYFKEVIGERKEGRENINSLNRIGNWIINRTFNFFFGTRMSDVCSGMYGLNVQFAKTLNLESKGFDIEVEIAAHVAEQGTLFQVPIDYGERLGQKKLQPWRDGFKIINTILKFARQYNSRIFSTIMIAGISFTATLLVYGWVALEWLRGIWHSEGFLLGLALLLISSQSFVISTIFSSQKYLEKKMIQEVLYSQMVL
jgi:dolichol-phosphate mannosyltransferase